MKDYTRIKGRHMRNAQMETQQGYRNTGLPLRRCQMIQIFLLRAS